MWHQLDMHIPIFNALDTHSGKFWGKHRRLCLFQ